MLFAWALPKRENRDSRNDLATLIFGSLREELSVNGSSKQIKSVAAAIMAEPEIEVSELDAAAGGLCLQNGVLNVTTFELYPHSPNVSLFKKRINGTPCNGYKGIALH